MYVREKSELKIYKPPNAELTNAVLRSRNYFEDSEPESCVNSLVSLEAAKMKRKKFLPPLRQIPFITIVIVHFKVAI